MKQFAMSRAALRATLHLMDRSGTCLLPDVDYGGGTGADDFLVGREELCRKGWAELDFDGKLVPSPEYARLIYDIAWAQATMRLELPKTIQWYLLAPTEMLFLELEGEQFRLERRAGKTLIPWMRQTLLPAVEGILTTQRKRQQRQSDLSGTKPGGEERIRELTQHLGTYFGQEAQDA